LFDANTHGVMLFISLPIIDESSLCLLP